MSELVSAGYRYSYQIVDMRKYGVPQRRYRLILLASRRSEIGFPDETHSASRYVSVRQCIGDRKRFPPLRAGESDPNIPNHQVSALTATNLRRIRPTPRNGGNRLSWQALKGLELPCYRKHMGHTDVYGRMCWDRTASTITTRFNSLSNGRFGHPGEDRAISLREGAALQTFPDDYAFFGSQGEIARHIGNAVPVRLAEVFGKFLFKMVENRHLA